MSTVVTHHRSAVRRRLAATLLVLASLLGSLGFTTATAGPAQASTLAARVLNEAAHHRGQPYVWAAAGPTRFDCSGFTLYVFGRFGKRLPHNAAQQYTVVRHVPKASMQVGDLIFLRSSSGRIGHVGIYAGQGRMWHSPHTGSVVKLAAIYSSNYVVGRL